MFGTSMYVTGIGYRLGGDEWEARDSRGPRRLWVWRTGVGVWPSGYLAVWALVEFCYGQRGGTRAVPRLWVGVTSRCGGCDIRGPRRGPAAAPDGSGSESGACRVWYLFPRLSSGGFLEVCFL